MKSIPRAIQAGTYKSQTGGITDTRTSLLKQAQPQLDSARTADVCIEHNGKLKKSFKDKVKSCIQEMDEAKGTRCL